MTTILQLKLQVVRAKTNSRHSANQSSEYWCDPHPVIWRQKERPAVKIRLYTKNDQAWPLRVCAWALRFPVDLGRVSSPPGLTDFPRPIIVQLRTVCGRLAEFQPAQGFRRKGLGRAPGSGGRERPRTKRSGDAPGRSSPTTRR